MGEDTNTAGIELPEDLSTVDDRGLASLKDKINKAFAKLDAKDRVSASELADMGQLGEYMKTVEVEETTRVEAQATADSERARLRAQMSGEGDGGEGDGGDAGDGAGEGADAGEGEGGDAAPAEGEGDGADGTGDEGAGDGAEGGEGVSDVTVEALAASFGAALVAALQPGGDLRAPVTTSPRPTAAEAAAGAADRNRPRERATGMPTGFNIVASSDTPGVTTGSHLDMDALDEAIHKRARAMGTTRGSGTKALIASIEKTDVQNDTRGLTNRGDIQRVWDEAHDVQAMVASGGFCGPTENIYDFACDFEAMPDEVDLPTMTTDRAGVNVPDALLLGDIINQDGIGEQWTNAMDIAADPDDPLTTKVCFHVPCPDWDETILEAQYTCVTAGNLADRTFPEGSARTRDLALLAHAHVMNGRKLTAMAAAATAVSPVLTGLTAAEAVLAGVEFVIARSRDQYFMSDDQILEVVLPRWNRHAIRRDLARRNGVDFRQVTNDEIREHFLEIGARVQFVTNWQMLASNATSYPNSVIALVYPAGAFTLLDGGSLDIAVIRDSVLNKTNDHTLLFFEEFWQLLTRCAAYKVTIPVNAWGGNLARAALSTDPMA